MNSILITIGILSVIAAVFCGLCARIAHNQREENDRWLSKQGMNELIWEETLCSFLCVLFSGQGALSLYSFQMATVTTTFFLGIVGLTCISLSFLLVTFLVTPSYHALRDAQEDELEGSYDNEAGARRKLVLCWSGTTLCFIAGLALWTYIGFS